MPIAQLAPADQPSVSPAPGFVGVSQVLRRANEAVRKAFPATIWVKGEVSSYKQHLASGHHYFDLVERTGTAQEVLPCAIWKGVWPKVKKRLAEADIGLGSGMEMVFQGELSIYAGSGKLSFKITDVYPEFTIGQLEVIRRAVLARLTKEDLIGLNRRLEMPPVPLRLAVVSSRTAEGLQDFMKALATSGYTFDAQLVATTLQGPGAEVSICRALEALAKGANDLRLDAVCIVRGGGSATDLAWWNSYPICAAIARMPVPVVTGIGHEKDRTVADEVAHHAASTPTAAAQHLIGLVRSADTELRDATNTLVTATARLMRDANHEVELAQQRFAQHTAARLSGEIHGLDFLRERLCADARRILTSSREQLAACREAAGRESERTLRTEASEITDVKAALATAAAQHLKLARVDSASLAGQVSDLASRAIDCHVTDHSDLTADLVTAAEQGLADSQGTIRQLAELVHAYDPARVLQRGYSITLNAQGKSVRSAQELTAGETIVTRLAEGQITSAVTQTNPGVPSDAD
jgi:exodeoxyribonuclease VII large subunit